MGGAGSGARKMDRSHAEMVGRGAGMSWWMAGRGAGLDTKTSVSKLSATFFCASKRNVSPGAEATHRQEGNDGR